VLTAAAAAAILCSGSIGADLKLASSLWSFRVALVAFASCRLFLGISEVQFGMIALRLKHIRTFPELTGFTAIRRLVLTFASWWLILSMTA
jgi:hypothetical protein